MDFNISYDATVTAAQQAAINAVAQFLENHFTDANNPVTINIAANFGNLGPTGLGASSTPLMAFTYAQIRNALIADQTTADDAAAALPATDPITAALPPTTPPTPPNVATYWMAQAEAKALDLLGASAANDGSMTFHNAANIFDYDRTDGITAGQFDFAGVVAHELTEIMGRTALVGANFGGSANSYELLDLYRFSAAGTRAITSTVAAYFSLDGGTTNLDDFNIVVGGDLGDWASTALVGNDSFLAFSGAGVVNAVMNTDFRVMDILGYDLVNATATVAALSKSTGEDGPFSQSLIEGAADTDGDFLTVVNLAGTVTTTGGRLLTLGTDYTLTGSTIDLTAAGLAKFNNLAQGATDTAVFGFNVTDFLAPVANTLTLTVNGLNDAPVAFADLGSAGENETVSFDVLANDTDVDTPDTKTLVSPLGTVTVTSDNLLVDGINASGAFTVDTNQIKFTPGTLFDALAVGDTATVVVDYTMQDSQSAQSSSTLTVTVNGVNDAPVFQSGGGGDAATYFVRVNNTAITTVVATDVDSGDVPTYLIVGGANANLFVIDTTTGDLAFKNLPAQPNRSYLVNVQADDGNGGIDMQAIKVNVAADKMVAQIAPAEADTFVFHAGFGANTVQNFDVATDFLQFDSGMFATDTAAAVLAAAHETTKGDVIIDTHAGNLQLVGVTLAQLQAHQDDFVFV